jgi:hypothetical protein
VVALRVIARSAARFASVRLPVGHNSLLLSHSSFFIYIIVAHHHHYFLLVFIPPFSSIRTDLSSSTLLDVRPSA